MLKNMKIGTKIISLVCIILVLRAITAGFGIIHISGIEDEVKEIAEVNTPLTELITEATTHQLTLTINFERALRFGMQSAEDQVAREAFEALKRDYERHEESGEDPWSKTLDEIIQRGIKESKSDARRKEFEKVDEILKNITEKHEEYESLEKQAFELIAQGKIEEAEVIARKMQPLGDQVNKEAKALLTKIGKFTEESVLHVKHRGQSVIMGMLIISILSIILGFGLGIFIARGIARPLNTTVGVAEQIAAGDLTVDVPSDSRRDEVGALTQAFTRMIRSLQKTAAVAEQVATGDLTVEVKPLSERDVMGNAVAVMVENLREQTREIMEGANVLASSANEISTTVTQFASSSTETATAVSQTTTTVEELTQTAQLSSQKAKNVSENAQEVAQISQIGEKSTEDTIEGMNRIREQMESIADSVVSFSEQSQAIGEIVATVDNLTERSNLLAVNASIEAAKAGEQGKGFTVVAEEIKSLAEQSKQATAQVRNILNDIQKATSAAVMVTEQGSKAVEVGVEQSIEAGEAIRKLTDSVVEASQAATQIAASSQQQLVGVDQVSSAMESIKQASEQNVDSTKQLETAAQNLNELGQRLKQLVERYKV